MNDTSVSSGSVTAVSYELIISSDEASQGAVKIMSRNGKRLQVNIPAGVSKGSIVKLTNALQITDNRPGDILIRIQIRSSGSATSESVPEGVIEINGSDFENEVLKSALPVVVDFWAAWCGPCRMMSPVIEEAAVQYRGRFKFCKVNVDENPVLARRYQAMSIPMLLFFKNGEIVERSVGAIPAVQLKAKLEALI